MLKGTLRFTEQGKENRRRRFDIWWRWLSARGECDDIGGEEYRRIKAEWEADGFHVHICNFIRQRANLSAGR